MVYSSPTNYWIKQGAITFTLNALGDPDKLAVAVSAGAVIMAYAKVNNQVIIDYNAGHNYRTWAIQASPTHFERTDKVYVYARLSKVADTAMLVFPYEKIPIDPALYNSSSSSSSDEGVTVDPNYYYILLGALTPSVSGGVQVNRSWDSVEGLSYGTLDTDEQWNEQSSEALDRMFRIDGNNVIWAQNNLTFVAGKRLLLLRMSVLGDSTGANTAEIASITKAANINDVAFSGVETSLPTTAAMVRYAALLMQSLANKFLSKEHNDSTPYKLTMREAEVTEDASVGGDLTVLGDEAVGGNASVGGGLDVAGTAQMHGTIQSDNFLTGLRGWKIDRNGNIEAETGHFRSAIITDELRINRQQAQEGDTIFAENDQIETLEEVVDNNETTYILTLKEKWEGYFTAQQYGNIIRGKINTLAAKNAGVSDYTGQEYQASQGVDAGGNKYYTSFFHVIATHNTNPALDVNQIQVVLYGDNEVPMSRNYPPCSLMAIARWGCRDYADPSDPHYEDTLASIQRRQSLFMVASSDGHIIKLTGVNKPILEDWNIGATFGSLPDFIKSWPIASSLIQGRDYLYAQGIVVGDVVKVDIQGKPIVQKVDCGEWVDGSSTGTVMIPIWDDTIGDYVPTAFPLPIPASEYDNPDSPYIGHGIYLFEERNNKTLQWETHQVWHNGQKWETIQHLPEISGANVQFYEPRLRYRNIYWKMLEGDSEKWMRIQSSGGYLLRRNAVNIYLTPTAYFGSAEIPDIDIPLQQWRWTRKLQNDPDFTDADKLWNNEHNGVKVLHLTNADMPRGWSVTNRLELTCIATLNDGINIDYIEWTIPV